MDISSKQFIQKLQEIETKLKKEYQPGKYYIIHEPDRKSFLFKNIKHNTHKESGIISKFQYDFIANKTKVRSSFRYATIFYLFLPLILLLSPILFFKFIILAYLAPLAAYSIFCFFLHLEAWVVTQEFRSLFQNEIVIDTNPK